MKAILSVILISSTILIGSFTNNDTTVYICNSGTTKKYHLKKSCRGLNACTHEIKGITLAKARSGGKTLCGWEE